MWISHLLANNMQKAKGFAGSCMGMFVLGAWLVVTMIWHLQDPNIAQITKNSNDHIKVGCKDTRHLASTLPISYFGLQLLIEFRNHWSVNDFTLKSLKLSSTTAFGDKTAWATAMDPIIVTICGTLQGKESELQFKDSPASFSGSCFTTCTST